MVVHDEIIHELTQLVWTTVLGLDVEKVGAAALESENITTSVDISGAWEGTVSLSLSRSLGTRLAAAMLACPESETTPAIVDDVVRELANMLGGNVKGLLPGPCHLSLPRHEAEPPDTDRGPVTRSVWFDCAGMPFRVTVRPRPSEEGLSP